jgi:enoyl-CoA hydratase/carnithine racemase|tara:strand:- start:3212 stop:4003 length:792 start_codon:yes stop_codon:yes gene_type:complete
MANRVTLNVENGVADVRLNRPEKLNALDNAMFRSLVDAGELLKSRTDVRAVVLSGEGTSFCSGLDLSSFQKMASSDTDEAVEDTSEQRMTHLGQQAAWVWQEIEVPVIGAIAGHALGGGFQVAMGPDIRLVHPETKLSVLEIRWGLTADMGATVLLPPNVRMDVMKELFFTGKIVTGIEAVDLGLATRVSDNPHAEAMEMAYEIAQKNPEAIKRMKKMLNAIEQTDVATRFESERENINALIGSPNQKEAIKAYFEKRAPKFS